MVWSCLRGDNDPIIVGANSNIQDNSVVIRMMECH